MKRPEVEFKTSNECFVCGTAIDPSRRGWFITWARWVRRGADYTVMEQTCRCCFDIEFAMREADVLDVRYTRVAVAQRDTTLAGFNGHRCACGAVSYALEEWCIPCWRERRMLQKELAEARFIHKLLTNLRKAVRDGNKNGRDAGDAAGCDRPSDEQKDGRLGGDGGGETGQPSELVDTGRAQCSNATAFRRQGQETPGDGCVGAWGRDAAAGVAQ